MNDILRIRQRLEQKPHGSGGGGRNVHAGAPPVQADHLELLATQLQGVLTWWQSEDLLPGAIVDIDYRTVIPKSSRVQCLLAGNGKKPNDTIVGARFSDGDQKHIITHYIEDLSVLEATIDKLNQAKTLLQNDTRFGGQITYEQIGDLDDSIDYASYGHSKSSFRNTVVDAYHVENFRIPQNQVDASQNSIVTIFDTGVDVIELMRRLGIEIQPGNLMYTSTLLLDPRQIELLNARASFLIAMSVEEWTGIDEDISSTEVAHSGVLTIDAPTDQPVIGVIDKMFSDQAYFSDWVEFHDMLDENIPRSPTDAVHGTAVSSIIVDGPKFNPQLEDGCGNFRVRHFGVATGDGFSSFTVMKLVRRIVIENPDIKVWNLSLGSDKEIRRNSISPEAAMLDQLQHDYDVIFVVAGTNLSIEEEQAGVEKLIGAPADSINSLVVNSVNASGDKAAYSRKGIVLSFFNKPDLSTFGGDGSDYIRVCTPTGEGRKAGTSFAAPWVTRKLAYLIHVLGLSREVAKALIIDSAAGWNAQSADHALAPFVGHGVVPTHIDNIAKSQDDEIRFIISGTSEEWDTYNYNLPVPVENDTHPFVTRATMCYFPKCSINQGVDYTNTELDLYFGRIADGKLTKYVKAINGNVQQVLDGERHPVNERDARALYRKWDNTKRVQDTYTSRTRAKEAYDNGLWGISVKTNDRLNNDDGHNIRFGIVATLKEINGRNRIETFVQQCQLRGWLVERLDVETQVDIYNQAQQTISFDE